VKGRAAIAAKSSTRSLRTEGAAGFVADRGQVSGREKQIYSIYTKMHEKHLSFSQVLDIYGFRVIVKDVPRVISPSVRCTACTSRARKFKDYIAIPRSTAINPFTRH